MRAPSGWRELYRAQTRGHDLSQRTDLNTNAGGWPPRASTVFDVEAQSHSSHTVPGRSLVNCAHNLPASEAGPSTSTLRSAHATQGCVHRLEARVRERACTPGRSGVSCPDSQEPARTWPAAALEATNRLMPLPLLQSRAALYTRLLFTRDHAAPRIGRAILPSSSGRHSSWYIGWRERISCA